MACIRRRRAPPASADSDTMSLETHKPGNGLLDFNIRSENIMYGTSTTAGSHLNDTDSPLMHFGHPISTISYIWQCYIRCFLRTPACYQAGQHRCEGGQIQDCGMRHYTVPIMQKQTIASDQIIPIGTPKFPKEVPSDTKTFLSLLRNPSILGGGNANSVFSVTHRKVSSTRSRFFEKAIWYS